VEAPVPPAPARWGASSRSGLPAQLRRFVCEQSGAALTELALVLPLLLLLLLGLIDFGKAFNYWIDETHLANEGARWAVVNKTPGGCTGVLQQCIFNQLETGEQQGTVAGTQGSLNPAKVNICFYKATDGTLTTTPTVGDTVKVVVAYAYNWLHYLTSEANIGPTTTITGSASMRLETVPNPAIISSANNTGGACPATA
jgi:Flp pilus assembly protein TadG